MMNLAEDLFDVFNRHDIADFDNWLQSYCRLWEVCNNANAKIVTEIGCRAGYSAFTFFHAGATQVNSFDAYNNTNGGTDWSEQHCRRILANSNHNLTIIDSINLSELPNSDLIYVDGDHSYHGCNRDLRLASHHTDLILCDDYKHPDHKVDITLAIMEFCEAMHWSAEYLCNGLYGLAVLRKLA